jgi:hypothetical protein
MTLAPPRESDLDSVLSPIELLIKEARARALRRRLTYGLGLAAAVVALSVVAAVGGSGSPVTTLDSHPGAARGASLAVVPCASAAVRVTLEGADGSMGTFSQLFWVRNLASNACSISGYPTVGFLNASGAPVSQVVTHLRGQAGIFGFGGTGAPPMVTLAPRGGVASFWVVDHDVPTGTPPAACASVPRVRVTWAHAAGGQDVTLGRFHQITSCGHVGVYPVLPGRWGAQPHKSLTFYFGTSEPGNPNYATYTGPKAA